jgi:hypothetical protein
MDDGSGTAPFMSSIANSFEPAVGRPSNFVGTVLFAPFKSRAAANTAFKRTKIGNVEVTDG